MYEVFHILSGRSHGAFRTEYGAEIHLFRYMGDNPDWRIRRKVEA